MKLKKIHIPIVIALIGFFLILLPIPVFAQTTINEEVAGVVTPDNPLYIFDVFGDDFLLFITTEPNEKALLGLQIANERLAEIDFSIMRSNLDSALLAQNEHDKVLSIVEESVAVPDEIDDDTVTTEEDLDEEFEKIIEIEALLKVHKAKVDVVKENVRIILQNNRDRLATNFPDRVGQITSGLDNAIERIDVRVDDEKTRIEIRFADDFDKSRLDIRAKARIFETMAGNEVEIRLSNSGQGSFGSGEICTLTDPPVCVKVGEVNVSDLPAPILCETSQTLVDGVCYSNDKIELVCPDNPLIQSPCVPTLIDEPSPLYGVKEVIQNFKELDGKTITVKGIFTERDIRIAVPACIRSGERTLIEGYHVANLNRFYLEDTDRSSRFLAISHPTNFIEIKDGVKISLYKNDEVVKVTGVLHNIETSISFCTNAYGESAILKIPSESDRFLGIFPIPIDPSPLPILLPPPTPTTPPIKILGTSEVIANFEDLINQSISVRGIFIDQSGISYLAVLPTCPNLIPVAERTIEEGYHVMFRQSYYLQDEETSERLAVSDQRQALLKTVFSLLSPSGLPFEEGQVITLSGTLDSTLTTLDYCKNIVGESARLFYEG